MKRFIYFFLAMISLIVCACNNNHQSDKIKVGVLMPLTGDLAFLGQSFTNAIMMSADTSKVELYIQDTKGEPKTAINIVNQLISTRNIDVVVSLKPAVSETINPSI